MHTAITAVLFSVLVGGAFIGASQAMRGDSARPTPVLDAVVDDVTGFASDLDGNLGKAKGGLRDFLDAIPTAVGFGDPYADDWEGEFPPIDSAPAAATAADDIPPGHLAVDERPSDNAPDDRAAGAAEDEDDPAGHRPKEDRKGARGD